MGQNPSLFLDSVETNMSTLQTLNPFDISNVSVVKRKKAKKLIGNKGADGAVYVTTIKAARKIYWKFFSTKSDEYRELVPSPQADTIVQYVLNGQPLTDTSAPGNLLLINEKNFKSLEIIDKEKILSDNVKPRRYVVAIKARRPKGLIKTSNSK